MYFLSTLVLFSLSTIAMADFYGSNSPKFQTSGSHHFGNVASSIGRPVVPILVDNRQEPDASGSYNFNFQTGDGVSRHEQGFPQGPTGAVAQQGGWSFTLPDGTPAEFNFIADENGFRVESDLIPTPPPLPAHAIAQIEKARREDAAAAASGIRGTYSAPQGSHFSRPSNQYAAPPAPQFSRPSNQYAAPPAPQFSRPSNQYAAPPAPQFSRPSNQFSRPSRPSNQYAAPPASQFSRPSNQYVAPPAPQFSRPSSQYGTPSASSSHFSLPSTQYGTPSASASQISRPSTQYGTPSQSFQSSRPVIPSQKYGTPSSGFQG